MSNNIVILYVEDDIVSRNTVCSILEEFYGTVLVAGTGEKALQLLDQNHVDILITDIGLPDISGMELIKKVREVKFNLPIIITSAYSDQPFLLEAIKSQVRGYLVKPLDLNELLKVIETIETDIKNQQMISEEKSLLRHYKAVTDQSSIVFMVDSEGIIRYVNDRFCLVTGYDRKELIGTYYRIGHGDSYSSKMFKRILDFVKKECKPWRGVIRSQCKNKKEYYVKTTVTPLLDQGKEEFMVLQTVVNDVIHPQEQFLEYLEMLSPAYIVLLKIENFHYFESAFSQLDTKRVFEEFADKIFLNLPEACTFLKIFILGNGEFALIQSVDSLPKEPEDVTNKLKLFHHSLNQQEIEINGLDDYGFSFLTSIAYGVDAFMDAKIGLQQLENSNNNFIVANGLKNKNDKHVEHLKLLKSAIDNCNVVSYFQPIVNNKTQKVEKYESLVRFIDEDGSVYSPYLFLKIAKRSRYYDQITSIVLKNSFLALDKTVQSISVNISAFDLEKQTTRKQLSALFMRYGAQSRRIILELTEDEDVKDFEVIKSFIRTIKEEHGIQVAIDDFGVGYSNFERVLDYEPNILKIDGKLIRNLQHDTMAYSIVESIVSFAKKENLVTVAEYVENESIYKIVCQMGIDYSQGYFFGKPDVL